MGETYESAGVSIAAGDEAVRRIGAAVASTRRPGVVGDIGSFGGLFALGATGRRDPLLVSSTDGVGTKAEVARATGRLDTIGIDLVAMCVDDIVCQGAEPLFFLDYVSVGHLDPERVATIVGGVAEGCRLAGCALIGGEMAEHGGVMEPDAFDLVGFAVGVVERDRVITGEHVAVGDRLIGLASPNLRSNGFTLARRVLFDVAGMGLDDPAWAGATRSLADELLDPSVIYAPAVLALIDAVDVRAVVHVTGGGLPGNVVRVLPAGCHAVVERSAWEVPRIFGEIQRLGAIADDEMARVFNLGIGMVVVVPAADVDRALGVLAGAGHRAVEIGEVVAGAGSVSLV
ncbi:MAG TPA: phosphoribosylformylglycinamidine cyclo-ligase [Acidimicrobiales bacterium]|nr:phosphoribosylformylglycinamidine cyclo-ligase [Acidimicrobiales bacterium]